MADRRSLLERRAALEGKQAELAQRGDHQPTEVHTATVDVLTHLLEMGKAFQGSEIPTPLRVLMRTVDKYKPTLTAELAAVPPEQIREFMMTIRDEIDKIVQASPEQRPQEKSA